MSQRFVRTPVSWAQGTALFAFLLLYFLMGVGDPLLAFYQAFRVGGAGVAAKELLGQGWFQYLIPLVLSASVLTLMTRRRSLRIREVIALALLFCTLAGSAALDLQQARANYSTFYFYGERGLEEAAKQLAAWATPQGTAICDLDIAYHGGLTTQTCHLPMESGAFHDVPTLLDLLHSPRFFGLCIRDTHHFYSAFEDPFVQRVLATEFEERRVGSFRLYQRREKR